MISFVARERPRDACQAPDHCYWDVFDKSKKVGWFGIFHNDKRTYTDVAVVKRFRGQGYFEKIYDHFLDNYWDHEINLYAFIGHDNASSIRAHEKYGCKIIKHNKSTDVYLVKRGNYAGNRKEEQTSVASKI